ncbi:hypothetical protein [Allorhizobium borbori]|uniref:Uncharacterized protein n=1 Tax=Allorhizobium borbori TaxID=485907 RepID=A0A7W6K0U6_9HYPH|nr:hypothetical protein [Allorhizobium borbori]MBB4103032.1 hypothetical protein [Allorhizobium borbori]
MAEPMLRADVLALLSNCPVCGSAKADFTRWGTEEKSARVRFECSAVFSTFGDAEIEVSNRDQCPAPSRVAASALEREFSRGAA